MLNRVDINYVSGFEKVKVLAGLPRNRGSISAGCVEFGFNL
jgi:hypothetical protein